MATDTDAALMMDLLQGGALEKRAAHRIAQLKAEVRGLQHTVRKREVETMQVQALSASLTDGVLAKLRTDLLAYSQGLLNQAAIPMIDQNQKYVLSGAGTATHDILGLIGTMRQNLNDQGGVVSGK